MLKLKLLLVRLQGLAFYIGGAAVVLGGVWFLLTAPYQQWGEITSLQINKEQLSDEVTRLDKAITILTAIDQKQLAQDLASVNAALPGQKKTSGLVAGLSAVASASGVVVRELTFSPGRIATESSEVSNEQLAGSKVRVVTASLSVGSDLPRLGSFLSKLQSASQLLGVSSVGFTAGSAREPLSTISLSVYYQPPSAGVIDWGEVRPVSDKERQILASLSSKDVFILPEEQR